jgi:cobalt-zinc-cadmium efflux system outer membrane protein
VDVEIDIPLFDRKQGDVRSARFDMARARAGKQAAESATSQEVAELYYSLAASESERETLKAEVIPAAREMFEAHSLGLDNRANDIDDLFDARRDLLRAELQYIDALVDYHQTLAVLEGVAGQRFE